MILDRSGVIMESLMVSGNHWSCVHINIETGDGLYADSIGQEVPWYFEDTFSNTFQPICKVYKKNDFIKSIQVAHEIRSTKSMHRCGYFRVKNFIYQRNSMIVCGAAAIFSAIAMSDFTIIVSQRFSTNMQSIWKKWLY